MAEENPGPKPGRRTAAVGLLAAVLGLLALLGVIPPVVVQPGVQIGEAAAELSGLK